MKTSNPKDSYVFRRADFYQEVAKILAQRGMSWRQLALEIGATPSSFTRWGKGRSLDGGTLAALSAWADLNPAEFVGDAARNLTTNRAVPTQKKFDEFALALRSDPSLTVEAAAALTVLLATAYDQLKIISAATRRVGKSRNHTTTDTPPRKQK